MAFAALAVAVDLLLICFWFVVGLFLRFVRFVVVLFAVCCLSAVVSL